VPPNTPLSKATLFHAWKVDPLNQINAVVSHVPVPPVPAVAPLTSHVWLV
jgi:hypothetical protein